MINTKEICRDETVSDYCIDITDDNPKYFTQQIIRSKTGIRLKTLDYNFSSDFWNVAFTINICSTVKFCLHDLFSGI